MSDTTTNSGIGFTGLLTIVFITLKLLDKIDWSWLWVLSPIWISLLLTIVVLIFVGIIFMGSWLVELIQEKIQRRKW